MDFPVRAICFLKRAIQKRSLRRRCFFHNICAHFYRETPPEMASILGKRVPSIARAARHAFVISARDVASARDNLAKKKESRSIRHFPRFFFLYFPDAI